MGQLLRLQGTLIYCLYHLLTGHSRLTSSPGTRKLQVTAETATKSTGRSFSSCARGKLKRRDRILQLRLVFQAGLRHTPRPRPPAVAKKNHAALGRKSQRQTRLGRLRQTVTGTKSPQEKVGGWPSPASTKGSSRSVEARISPQRMSRANWQVEAKIHVRDQVLKGWSLHTIRDRRQEQVPHVALSQCD